MIPFSSYPSSQAIVYIIRYPFGVLLCHYEYGTPSHVLVDYGQLRYNHCYWGRLVHKKGVQGWFDVNQTHPALCNKIPTYLTVGQMIAIRIVTPAFGHKPYKVKVAGSQGQFKYTAAHRPGDNCQDDSPLYAHYIIQHPNIAWWTNDESIFAYLSKLSSVGCLNQTSDIKTHLAQDLKEAITTCYDLAGGGRMLIACTAACTVIDVDMVQAQHEFYAFNLGAFAEIMAKIKFLRLGGVILIDLPRMPLSLQQQFALQVASFKQPHLKLLGFTRGGLFEIEAHRQTLSLYEILQRFQF